MSSLKLTLQSPEQIAYFLGANNYCWLHFRQGEKKLLAKPLSYMEAQLPSFIRVHKTVLVNPSYIKSLHQPPYKKMPGEVHMETGEVFPLSRQRRTSVLERFLALTAGGQPHQQVSEPPTQPVIPLVNCQLLDSTTLSIVLVSSDKAKALQAEHLIDQHWSAYQFKAVQASSLLVDVLNQSSVSTYPALILVDAQTKSFERLLLLRSLKESRQLRQIPVVLFVSPSDQLIVEGYEYQANSVIVLPDRYTIYEELVERVLHYWLGVVALPQYYEE